MAQTEKRTLEIVGSFKDQFSGRLKGVRAALKSTGDAFKATFRAITRPITGPLKALDTLSKKILSVRNVLGGLIAVAAARQAFGFFTGISDQLNEIDILARRIGATVESVSVLRHFANQSRVSIDDLQGAFASLSQQLQAARQGSVAQADAFRALGVDMESLAEKGKLDLVAVLGDIAGGLGNLESVTERNAALMALFGEAGLRLVPLLESGADGVRRWADEAERLGVVFDERTIHRARSFERALGRLQTSFTGLRAAIFEEFAPKMAAVFDSLANVIAQNRDRIVGVFQAIGRGVLSVIDLIAEGFIGLIETIERLPFIDLAAGLREEREKLQAKLEREGHTFRQMLDLDGVKQRLAEIDATLAKVATGGFAAELRRVKASLTTQLGSLVAAASQGPAAQQVATAGAALGTQFGVGFQDGVRESIGEGAGTLRAALTDQRHLLETQRALLNLVPPSEEVRDQLAGISIELDKLALGERLIPFLQKGTIGADAMAAALAGVEDSAKRTREELERMSQLRFEFELDRLRDRPTKANRIHTAERDAAATKQDFAARLRDGQITPEQFAEGLKRVDEQLDTTIRKINGDFMLGFSDAAKVALEGFTDLTAAGERAAQTLLSTGFDGLKSALSDTITRVKSAKDAFSELGKAALKALADIASELLTVGLFKGASALFGLSFEGGGIMPGQMHRPSSGLTRQNFAFGGVANRPMLAQFGEGNTAEAFVPLPDGRHIPVDLRGGGGGDTHYHIHTIDSKDTSRWFLENRGLIAGIQNNALSTNTRSRQAVRRVR